VQKMINLYYVVNIEGLFAAARPAKYVPSLRLQLCAKSVSCLQQIFKRTDHLIAVRLSFLSTHTK
jgi:hypothetical protein